MHTSSGSTLHASPPKRTISSGRVNATTPWVSAFIACLPGDAIIVHGELEVVRLALDGTIQWSAGARDIFTGPFVLVSDRISATDFKGRSSSRLLCSLW
jgi:hypothetical protein